MASYAKLQRLSRRYVLLAVVYALLQQLLQLLLHPHRHDVALQTRYQPHDLVDAVFAMTQLRLHPSDAARVLLRGLAQAAFRIERVGHKLNFAGE